MYSSYSAAAFALRSAKPSYNAHSSSYLPSQSHHCQQYDADGGQRELVPLNPHLSPRFLLEGYLLRHSAHLLLLSARLRPPPPSHPPHCCHRLAAARCCSCRGGGCSAGSYHQHVPWRLEASAHGCCGQRTRRSDLGVVCRRLKARGCGCDSSGSDRLVLGTSCGNRGTPRLLGRAVRQEVWEYDGGEWPHRRYSMECHDDWDDDEEEEDDQCDLAQWELQGKSRLRRRAKEEEEDDRCRDCRRRKGVENDYYVEGEHSGRRRENRDMNGIHGSIRSARKRLEQRGYLNDKDTRLRREMAEERDRREFDFDDARKVGDRRYSEDDRKYDRRRERRDSEYDDVYDARRLRTGRYTEDDQKFDRRTERRDFEIDNEDDVRRDGRRHRNDDESFVIRNPGRKKYSEEDVSPLGSHRRHDNECYDDDQDISERKHNSRGRSQSSASAYHKDDSQRASSSRNTVDTSLARENSSSRVRWDDNVDQRAAQTSDERNHHYSCYVRLSNDEKDEYDYDDARLVRVRDSRTGTKDVKVITEDDTSLISSSKNSSILKHRRDVDQQVAARNESEKISQRIMETAEVRGNNTELDSAILSNHQEDRRKYIDNKSSSLQSSVNIASDSRRQIDRHDEVEMDQQVVALNDSRKKSEKLTDIKMDNSHNTSRASHSQRNYEEVNQMDIDDNSTSIENITHIVRDKKRYVNQQVIHETDIDVQNVTHVDVSTVRASDISMSRNSQNHSETGSDVNSIFNTSLIGRARVQQEQIHQNKVIASDMAIVRGSQSHHNTGVYGQVHSASVIGSTKEMQVQMELTKARTNNAATTSSESHIETRIYDRSQPSSSVHTASSVKGQTDLTKNYTSDSVVVSNSHNRIDNQARRTSVVNLVEARDSRNKSNLQTTQGSSDRSDQAMTAFSESSRDSREILTSVEETGRLMKHNMDLNSQQESTRRISDNEDTTSLQIESSEEASTINLDMEQRGTILGRTVSTATESILGDSSARKSANESVLESAARLEKSSTFHVGQFVDELQRGATDADITSTKKNEKSVMEGITRSSSRSRMKGPSDEIWDVQSTTSQETFKTADKEEGSSADGGTNTASQTPKNENGTAIAKKVHKSLWAYVADIVRLGWVQRGESHDSSNKSFKKSSSINSQSTEGWLSSQGHDNDSIEKRNWSTKTNDHQLMKSHSGESGSVVASKLKDENLPTGTQGLQISAAGNVPEVGKSKGDFVPTVSKDGVQISGERAKQSEEGASPKGSTMGLSAEDSISTLVDVTIGQPLEDEAATSSRITTQASAEINAGKGVSAGTSSVTIKADEAGRNDGPDSWRYGPSVAITPYHIPQTQAMIPHGHTSSASFESAELSTGGSTRMEEMIFVRKAPEFTKTEGKDAELNRRKIQRNKQVLKETFEEWEEAYQHDAKQRKTDELFMREALLEAQRAADIWEVPVGAVLVHNGEIIARGCNLVEDLRDSTAHAEIVCIREASSKLTTWRLADTTLYVTLEPCAMCAGAILQARVDTVVWGAPNKLLGADGSWVRLFPGDGQTSTLDPANQNQTAGPVHPFHPKIIVRRGVLSTECSEKMQQFFQLRRKKKQRPESPPRARLFGHHHHPIKFFTKVHHMFGAVFCL